jgi:hypothetical protein
MLEAISKANFQRSNNGQFEAREMDVGEREPVRSILAAGG